MADPARWIPVGELAHAFAPDSNAPSPTEELAGTEVELHLENDQVVRLGFETADALTWSVMEGTGRARAARESYFAAKIREGVYFVDFVRSTERAAAVSLVMDRGPGVVTALLARLPAEAECKTTLAERIQRGEELTAVSAVFCSGVIDAPFTPESPRHLPTTEMVGARVAYTYSSTERYEHIYLNENFYTWHCLAGSEKGLADTDRCHYYKIGDNLYFFVWREKIVPTLGAVVVDFAAMKTTGKIFGYQGSDFDAVVNFPVGARARILNVTDRS